MPTSERINSQVSSACENPIGCVDPGGLKIISERINSQLSSACEKPVGFVDQGVGLMIVSKRINSQLSAVHEKPTSCVDPGRSMINIRCLLSDMIINPPPPRPRRSGADSQILSKSW